MILIIQDNYKTEEAIIMIEEMTKLKEIVLHKLLTTPVEENERSQYLDLVSKRERFNAGIIEKLEAQLAAAEADRDKEVSAFNNTLRNINLSFLAQILEVCLKTFLVSSKLYS